MWTTLIYVALGLIELAVIARAITRPHRDPSSRIAWVVVIAVLPVAGIIAYLLFGETNIGRKRVARARAVLEGIPPPADPLPRTRPTSDRSSPTGSSPSSASARPSTASSPSEATRRTSRRTPTRRSTPWSPTWTRPRTTST